MIRYRATFRDIIFSTDGTHSSGVLGSPYTNEIHKNFFQTLKKLNFTIIMSILWYQANG